ALKKFLHGVNFGNFLEVPPSQNWALKHTEADVEQVKAEGFDHIRIPIGWHHYAGPGPEFTLTKEIFAKVDNLGDAATKRGLNVLINIHHFDEFTSDPARHKDRFLALWKQIAEHYKDAPDGVAFELLNEPKDKATTTVLNPIYAEAIALIRKSNPKRTL